ncbi:MAG TPA: DUF3592 domain-containing protein [Polyangium sp.]|nr:DUF3592 domain-containing protein [Polyangium sp.]
MTTTSNKQDNSVAWITLGLALTFALMGAIFVGVGVKKNQRATASLNWPSTEATIVSSGRSSYRDPGESIERVTSSTEIRYAVAGQTFEFRTSGLLRLETTGKAEGEPYPPNSKVRIYYNPSDPGDHEFEFTRGETSRAFEIVGGIIVLVTLPFFALAAKLFRRRSPA